MNQFRLTQHKRFALRAHPNFYFTKTYFMLGTLYKSENPERQRE